MGGMANRFTRNMMIERQRRIVEAAQEHAEMAEFGERIRASQCWDTERWTVRLYWRGNKNAYEQQYLTNLPDDSEYKKSRKVLAREDSKLLDLLNAQ
ncbi:MAG: hypothetical protein IJS16_08455 [Butyrivibrio sp.]|jgi:hypothetical protein|nr:hypothetical protein [Butyrivibrio sp.]